MDPDSAARRNRAPLDWLNFFLADVKDGLGPFLAIFLLSAEHWNPAQIGIVLTVAGLTTVLARPLAGALVDAVAWKRTLLAVAAAAIAAACATMALAPTFWPVALAQGVSGVADAIFPSAIAGISLGIVGRHAFTRRVGRNEAFNHAGNAFTAIAAGLAGSFIHPSAVLWIGAALALASIVAVFRVDGRAIDQRVARGADDGREGAPGAGGGGPASGLRVILACRPLLLFTAAVTLFHFANAAMLPLLGEELAQGHGQDGSLFIAACIIVAQVAMVPMAILVGRRADRWGRKPLFLVGFAVLPIRGVLYTLVHGTYPLVAIQVLDGVGAGIFGALFFVVVADLTRGTGRYNLALGASSACWGLGAALSNVVAGEIAHAYGFDAAFLFLAVCAAAAFMLLWLGVPETRDAETSRPGAGGPVLASAPAA